MKVALYLDHGVEPEQYVPLAKRCIESVRKHMPDVPIVHLTSPMGPHIPEADERIAAAVEGPFMYRRCHASAQLTGDVLYVDADTVFLADVRDVFELNFHVAIPKHINPAHPWLAHSGGAIFCRAPEFWQNLAKFGRHVDWIKADPGGWLPIQLVFNWMLQLPHFKVHLLPARIYDYKPLTEDDPCAGARILHFKGKRRKQWAPHEYRPELDRPIRITPGYLEMLKKMHEGTEERTFGVMSNTWAPFVEKLASEMVTTSILDYGCGSGGMAAALPELPIREYDPAVEGKDAEPEPADLVVCTDVLEHIEPQCVDAVLDHMRALTGRSIFLTVYIGPAEKFLPDGRNAHLIQEHPSWWIERINSRWSLIRTQLSGHHLVCVANGDKLPTRD